jgi:flagellar biosynthesis/type III secretory pathway protein FliH
VARIVKGGAAGPRRIEAAEFEATERARAIVADAEAHARDIVAAAQAERECLQSEAIAQGRSEGLARAGAILAGAAAERDRRLASAEREIAALALDVARKVLGRELAQDPGAVADLAAQAVAVARDRREVTLRVNPQDAGAIRSAAGRLAALLARAPGVDVREDPAIERGGAVVETEAGRIDARVETQLAALARALEEAER